MTQVFDFNAIETAVHSLIESHLETGTNLESWPDMWPLIRMVYPDVEIPAEGLIDLHSRDVDIYRLDLVPTGSTDPSSQQYAIGEQRLQDRLVKLLSLNFVSHVLVIKTSIGDAS